MLELVGAVRFADGPSVAAITGVGAGELEPISHAIQTHAKRIVAIDGLYHFTLYGYLFLASNSKSRSLINCFLLTALTGLFQPWDYLLSAGQQANIQYLSPPWQAA